MHLHISCHLCQFLTVHVNVKRSKATRIPLTLAVWQPEHDKYTDTSIDPQNHQAVLSASTRERDYMNEESFKCICLESFFLCFDTQSERGTHCSSLVWSLRKSKKTSDCDSSCNQSHSSPEYKTASVTLPKMPFLWKRATDFVNRLSNSFINQIYQREWVQLYSEED